MKAENFQREVEILNFNNAEKPVYSMENSEALRLFEKNKKYNTNTK